MIFANRKRRRQVGDFTLESVYQKGSDAAATKTGELWPDRSRHDGIMSRL